MSESIYEDVYAIVRIVPEGKVVTYGQVARLIGRPRHARQVGYALAALGDDHDVPWHRVINSKGEVSTRAHPDYENYQKMLLEEEGIEFGVSDRVSLKHFQWADDEPELG